MNILMALSQLEITGAEVYATELGNALSARGHQVHYVSDTLTKSVQGQVFKLRFNKRSLLRRFWHIFFLIYLIRRHKIQLVHAHSRASGWSSYVACKLTRTPMVTTVHGRQPVHTTRKRFHALGFRALAVCEAVANQIMNDLGVPPASVSVVRNGVNPVHFGFRHRPDHPKPVISIIGRLTGPKGNLTYRLLDKVLDLDGCVIRVITGSEMDSRFERFLPQVDFRFAVNDIPAVMADSDLVIGAGRVAVEALLVGTPVFAAGEASILGLVNLENLDQALACNFGDIGATEPVIDPMPLRQQIALALETRQSSETASAIRERVAAEYDLERMVDQIEAHYQSAVVHTLQREMPILMYHRFIENDQERGIHGTWMKVDRFEAHLKLLRRLGYESLTFADFLEKGFVRRLDPGRKFVMITADDGYQDNLTRMLPLLKKYGFKAVVYVVSDETHNRWDTENTETPDIEVRLMTASEIRELSDSGWVEIGGHTLTHAKLDLLSSEAPGIEFERNKARLEEITGKPILSFAYPYGRLNSNAKAAVKQAGYRYAVATDSGSMAMHEDLYQIRRIAIFPRTDSFGLWRKVRGNYVFRRAH
jgi:peptidoglycan/xylan/chitin deacetylase (PgdA/CDA1 family)/glycosyltransferase involved in cell wall biosynthesis